MTSHEITEHWCKIEITTFLAKTPEMKNNGRKETFTFVLDTALFYRKLSLVRRANHLVYPEETSCRSLVLVWRVCCKALIEVNSLCSALICHCKRATLQNATINGRNRNSCFSIYGPNTLRAF